MSTDPFDLATHPGEIYRMCVEGVLHGQYRMTMEGSSWVPAPDMVEYPYGQLPSDVVQDAYLRYSDILRDFDEFQQMPRPEHFDALIAQLETLVSHLSVSGFVDPDTRTAAAPNGVRSQVQDVRDGAADWQGKAATSFRSGVINRLEDTTGGMFALAWVALCATRAERKVWEGAWTDVHQIAHDTIDTLLYRGASTATFDAVLGAVQMVSSYIPVVGTVVSIASDALTVIKVLNESLPGDGLCSFADPDPVVAEMRDQLSGLKKAIADQETRIADGLGRIMDAAGDAPRYFEMPIPEPLRAPALEGQPGYLD